MQPMPAGTPIRVRHVDPGDSYQVGREYVVHLVDASDGTFRARDPRTGTVGNWLRWEQVELGGAVIGWSFLKTALSPETVRLLEAFDGVDALVLREDVADTLLATIPDLPGRLRDLSGALDKGLPPLRQKEIPDFLVGLDGLGGLGRPTEPLPPLVELDAFLDDSDDDSDDEDEPANHLDEEQDDADATP